MCSSTSSAIHLVAIVDCFPQAILPHFCPSFENYYSSVVSELHLDLSADLTQFFWERNLDQIKSVFILL